MIGHGKRAKPTGPYSSILRSAARLSFAPFRKEETLTVWLLTHPEIDVISRDRGGEYAAAARKGAPQAQQIADKFHIVKNLRDGLKGLMARKQKVLPEVEEVSSDGIPLRAQGKQRESAESEGAVPGEPQKRWRSMSKEPRRSCTREQSLSSAQSRSQTSRANRLSRYEAVRALHRAVRLRARNCPTFEYVAPHGTHVSCLRVL